MPTLVGLRLSPVSSRITGLLWHFAGNQEAPVILITLQGLVTVVAARTAGLDQAVCETVQIASAGDHVAPSTVGHVGGVLRPAACGSEYHQGNQESPARPAVHSHGFDLFIDSGRA